MIYFDNSATLGFVPSCVKRAAKRELDSPANAGRSGHKRALAKLFTINEARKEVAEMFNCEIERVIFTKSCTESLNLAIFGLVKNNSHIVTTAFEHNSVLRPLYSMKNVNISIANPILGRITAKAIEKNLTERTDIVVLNLVSNVTGNMAEYEEIAALCRQRNIKLICDGAQACSHLDLDIKKLGIAMLAIAPHKSFYVPSGLGILLVNNDIQTLKPIILGGNGLNSDSVFQGSEFPESFESGTQNNLAIACLLEGIKYFKNHKEHIFERTKMLSEYLFDSLIALKNIRMYSAKNPFGIASFLLDGFDSSEVSDYLDKEYNIATRSGLTCAPLAHKFLGTVQSGLVRVSLCHFNKKREIDKLIEALCNLHKF